MRKTGLALGIGILVFAGIAAGVLANPNRHRAFIQAQLENQLGRKVTLGAMELGLIPLRFQVKDAAIAEDPSMNSQTPFVRADQLDIRISAWSLLRGEVQFDSIELRKPSVELVRNAQGGWNFATLGARTTDPGANSASPSEAAGRELVLERLAIVDGQVGITDLAQGRPRAGYDHIDLTLLGVAAGKPFSFDIAARIEGEGKQELRFAGEAGPVSATGPADTPFHGTLSLTQVGLDGLLKFLDTSSIGEARGKLSGQNEIANQSGVLKVSGQIKLEGAQFNGLDIGYPIALDYALNSRAADGLVTIENAAMQLGSTPLTLKGTLNTGVTPAVMDVRIQSGDVAVTELARLASAFGVAFAAGTSVSGRLSADVRAKGSTAKPEWTGTIAGRDLRISGPGIPQPVQVSAVDLRLTPTEIRSNEFMATSGKTTVAGRFSLLQYASKAPSIDLALRAPGATLQEIQSITKAYGVTGLDQLSGEGSLNFDLRAKGPLQTLSTAAALRALNGVINVDFSPLQIEGFDSAYELGKLAGFVSADAGRNQTDILRVAGRILVKDGVAQTDDLKAQLGIGSLSTSGTADLATEALNLKLSAVFSKEFTGRAGNTRAGSLVKAALTNSTGELVLPAIVTGSFQKPKFSPDLKALAELQKEKLLPTLVETVGTLTGKSKTAAGEPEGEKRPVIKGILEALGLKKKEESAK